MTQDTKLEPCYADRDVTDPALIHHYTRHVFAMTEEDLHSKADIAAELAWRDAEIERLKNTRTTDRAAVLDEVRECFLNMIADAKLWQVDYDGDVDAGGRAVGWTYYRLEAEGQAFEQLPEALGIKPGYMESMEDAIERALAQPTTDTGGET